MIRKKRFSNCKNFKKELGELYRKYNFMVLRRCFFLLRDKEQAEDAMQETFVGILKRKLDSGHSNLSSYIYRAATNTCLNFMKRQKKFNYADNEISPDIPVYDNHENLLMANMTLDRILKSEKNTTKRIAVLHYIYDLNLTQTANVVGMSVAGLRKRLKKLRDKCRHYQLK